MIKLLKAPKKCPKTRLLVYCGIVASIIPILLFTYAYELWSKRPVLLNFAEGRKRPVWLVGFFSQKGDKLFGISDDSIVIWSASSRQLLNATTLQGGGIGYCAAVSPTDSLIAGGSRTSINQPNNINIWDTRSGKIIKVLIGHKVAVTSMNFSRDAESLASSDNSGIVRIWAIHKATQTKVMRFRDAIRNVKFSDSDILAVEGIPKKRGDQLQWQLRNIQFCDLRRDKLLPSVQLSHEHSINNVDISPDGKTLASISADGSIKLWQVSPKQLLRSFVINGNVNVNSTFCFLDNDLLAIGINNGVYAGQYGTLKIISKSSGSTLRSLKVPGLGAREVTLSPDSKTLATFSFNGEVLMWP